MKKISLLSFCLVLSIHLYGQESTYKQVYTILKNNCATCHGGTSPAAKLDLSGDAATVYQALIAQESVNPYAKEQGYQLVMPGYPDRSFLYRKCNNDLYPSATLNKEEGQRMPSSGAPALAKEDIELIRQWILFGAPETEQVVDPALITAFYNGEGLERLEQPPVPDPTEGFQVYMGPVFLAPGQEYEYHKKHDLQLETAVEVKGLDILMNESSHHCALFKYNEDAPPKFSPEIRPVNSLLDNFDYFFETTFIVNSQYPSFDLKLPEGTAFFWDAGTHIDLNYHIKNYSNTGILAAEFYLNIYTQETGTAEYEMFSETINYGGSNPFALSIDNNGQDTTFILEHFLEDQEETRYYWLMQGHTHQTGVDYDMFMRNADGSKGVQVYEGFFDATYQFDQGYWDYAHPPLLQNNPLLKVEMEDGLLMEATYNNDTDKKLSFGLTTADEMFAGYLLYTLGRPKTTSTEGIDELLSTTWQISPNPTNQDVVSIHYEISQTARIELQLYDMLGRSIQVIQAPKIQQVGQYQTSFTCSHLDTGLYFLELLVDGKKSVQKLLIQ